MANGGAITFYADREVLEWVNKKREATGGLSFIREILKQHMNEEADPEFILQELRLLEAKKGDIDARINLLQRKVGDKSGVAVTSKQDIEEIVDKQKKNQETLRERLLEAEREHLRMMFSKVGLPDFRHPSTVAEARYEILAKQIEGYKLSEYYALIDEVEDEFKLGGGEGE